MAITVTAFFAFHPFTIRTHVLPPKMVSFHEFILHGKDINFLFELILNLLITVIFMYGCIWLDGITRNTMPV